MKYGYLAHHGIKGQKWGIRRYQNADGSLTAEGIARYGGKGIKKKHLLKDSKGSYILTDKGAKFYNKYNKDNKLNSGDKVQLEKYATALSKRAKKKAAIGAVSAIATIGIGSAIAVKCIKNGKSITEDEVERLSDNDVDTLKPDYVEPDYVEPDYVEPDRIKNDDPNGPIFSFNTVKAKPGETISNGMRLLTKEEASRRTEATKSVESREGQRELYKRTKEERSKLMDDIGIEPGDFSKSYSYEEKVKNRANNIARKYDAYAPDAEIYKMAEKDISKEDPEGAKIYNRVKKYETESKFVDDRVKSKMIKERMNN